MCVTPHRSARLGQRRRHRRLVLGIGARPRQRHGQQRQPDRRRLRLQKRPPDGVHRDPVERRVQRRQQPDDLDLAGLTQDVQRPGGVFAAAPRQQGAWSGCDWNGIGRGSR